VKVAKPIPDWEVGHSARPADLVDGIVVELEKYQTILKGNIVFDVLYLAGNLRDALLGDAKSGFAEIENLPSFGFEVG
jgi:hypothetical protein